MNLRINKTLKKASEFKNVNIDSVIYYCGSALNMAREINNKILEYESLVLMAKTNIKAGNFGDAIKNSLEAEKIVKINNFSEHNVEVTMLSGASYLAMGYSKDALEYFLKAQNLISNETRYVDIIDLDYYLGSVYSEINELEKSQKHLQSSLAVSISHNLLLHSIKTYMFLSSSYDNPDSISKYLNLANRIISDHPDLLYKKVVLRNKQARLNKAIGNLALSKKQYLEAINISLSNGFQDHLTYLYNNYAYLLMAETNYDSAKIILNEALIIAKNIKSTDLQASIYDSYSDYFTKMKDYKNALTYQDSSISKRNQHRKEQRIQESLFISAVFETEQKEKEILQQKNEISRLWLIQLGGVTILLIVIGFVVYFRQKFSLSKSRLETVEKGRELELADALIIGQDTERKRLAMDLHDGLSHRVSSLTFIVDGFFKSHNKYVELTNTITDILTNIRELSHRMLPTQLENLGLITTIKNMASTINKSDKFFVEFETDINKRLSNKLEINLYYLINELVNNATKHSNGNNIFVQLYEYKDSFSLSVEDNGRGIKTNETSDGMGLKNIRSRVEYLGGTISIDSKDSGAIFMILIPKYSK